METAVRLCWVVLALVHVPPAFAVFAPGLLGRLYGVDHSGDVGLLLLHRAVLFLAVVAAAAVAAFDSAARPTASLVVVISVVGFLVLYLRTGSPPALRSIAIVDLVAVVPLAVVLHDAWVRR